MRRNQRGGVLVEMAFVALLATPLLIAGIHFGRMFYIYNLLEKSVRDGARYAATRTYTNADDYNRVIRNVVLNGSVGSGTSLIPDLEVDMVEVTEIPTGGGRPERIKITIQGYTYTGVMGTLTFKSKPSMEVPFIGMYMPPLP